MDIPAIMNLLPLETRMAVRKALGVIVESGLLESIMIEERRGVLEAAMVLANSREPANIEHMERVAIQLNAHANMVMGLTLAMKETY